jgi:hypothetical protein
VAGESGAEVAAVGFSRIIVEEIWRRSEDALRFGHECGGERRFLGSWGLR